MRPEMGSAQAAHNAVPPRVPVMLGVQCEGAVAECVGFGRALSFESLGRGRVEFAAEAGADPVDSLGFSMTLIEGTLGAISICMEGGDGVTMVGMMGADAIEPGFGCAFGLTVRSEFSSDLQF